jgi:hypothetical protein
VTRESGHRAGFKAAIHGGGVARKPVPTWGGNGYLIRLPGHRTGSETDSRGVGGGAVESANL